MADDEGAAQQRRQQPAAPLASLTVASSRPAAPRSISFRRLAAPGRLPAVISRGPAPLLQPLTSTPRPPRPAAAAAGTPASSSTARAGQQQQQQQRRWQGGLRPWAVPLAAGALLLHLARSAAAHVLAPGRQPPSTGDTRVAPSLLPRRIAGGASGPPSLPGGRRPAVVWFRNDLRLADHEPLAAANAAGTSLLPVYVFDPREYGKAPSGWDKTGPYRARFILEALADLRRRLRDAGSDLLLRCGKPEEVLPELVAAVGAGAVYCTGEVTAEEAAVEAAVAAALDKRGAALKVSWGGTLFHADDLPFALAAMPPAYSQFRAALAGRAVRAPVPAPAQLKGLPAASVTPGELPTLQQLGFDAATLARCASDSSAAAAHLRGGESEAQRRLAAFVASSPANNNSNNERERAATAGAGETGNAWAAVAQGGASGSNSGSGFCCKISPWLALGCLSPRQLYVELQGKAGRGQQQAAGGGGGAAATAAAGPQAPGQESDAGMQWLLFELLWRDFFRFITKKHTLTGAAKKLKGRSSPVLQEVPAAPALAMA